MEAILINRLSTFIGEIRVLSTQAYDIGNDLNDDNLERARIVSAKLKSVLSRFSSELYNYFNICKNPDPEEISDFTTQQLQAEENLAELDTKLKSKCENQPIQTAVAGPSSFSKLPDLKLPQFSGDLLEWHQFWDMFNSNISRRNLNDVDKLLYLKSSLKGDAARLVDGLNTTNRSYPIAVDTLKARYGKEHEVIHAHHQALNKVKRAETVDESRTTLDELQRHLRVLQSLGENTDTNQMRFLVMEKFPADMIYETKMRLVSDNTKSVDKILEQLSLIIATKEEAKRLTQQHGASDGVGTPYTTETLHITSNENPGPSRNASTNGKGHFKKPQRDNFKFRSNGNYRERTSFKRKHEQIGKGGNGNGDKRKKRWHCIFCGQDHLNKDCEKVKTIEERKKRLKDRCFNCFKRGHNIYNCRQKKKCEYCDKYGSHNQALCPSKFERKPKTEKESTNIMHINSTGTVLQTAIVEVQGLDNTTRTCRVLLDTGSGKSYITESMAKTLNLQTEEYNNLLIFTFGSQTPREIQSSSVKLGITTRNNKIKMIFANVVPIISHGVPHPDTDLLGWKNERKYQLADDGSLSDRIDLLIGNDYYYTFMSTNKIKIREDLYLIESTLGWILSGRIYTKPIERLSVLTYFQTSCEVGLNQVDPPLDNLNLKRLWDLESIGITDSPKANRDEEAIKHFNETTEYRNKRYYVSWPWNDNPKILPTNFGLAFGRLANLVKRLDLDTLKLYNETLHEQLNKEIIEVVPEGKVDHAIHYIPHHGVSAPGKTLRIVYDASAKVKDNKSLNEHLYCGPLLLEDLTGLLIKFRCHRIGLTADVEKAFLQIGLKQQDRDVTRFLWLKDIKKPVSQDNIVHLRFTRVPFGFISSPFILNATVKHHLKGSKNEDIQKVANDIYVDNLVTGAHTDEEALELYHNLKNTFNQISMNLRQWSSNSETFLNSIPDAMPDKNVKLLGLDWNLKDDTLSIRAKVNESNAYTKRGILKTIAAVYDPCGFSVPIMLSAKILLQDLWKSKVKWDTALDDDFTERWKTILIHMKEIENIQVLRNISNVKGKETELHCFTDSSMQAYAAVVYLVQGNNINFLIGKSRLVPIKDQLNLKIPRLELLGVLIGSRLIKYVLKFIQFHVSRQILWTDSQIVINWYNSDKLLTPFVARRLEEIKQKDLIIRHVPSELNPADVSTRPSVSEDDRSRWLLGPGFLKKNREEWPMSLCKTVSLLAPEGLLNAEVQHKYTRPDEELRVVKSSNKTIKESPELPQEMKLEGSLINKIKAIQAKYFKDEVNGKQTSLSRNLGLFKDVDGILRCKGRLKYADWSFDKRYPVILPKDCEFTNRVIIDTHKRNYHVGVNHTLSIIRQSYWIPQGKSQVKKILKKCPRCIKHGGGPFKLSPTPALPYERVNYSKPFTFTGVDYLGPILVKTEKCTSKRWICLFTCLAIRAVHLEVVQDLSAEEGLHALRRMISNRGVPTLIISDNALHFKLISDIICNAYCVDNKIKWRFIPELAPWHGGFYERLVGIIKQCMRRTLQKHLLTDNQLVTIIKEIEAVTNTRPLTCIDTEMEHILKPSDFLQPGLCVTLNTADNDVPVQGTSTKINLIMGWKRSRVILEEYKEMFQNRYLPSLRERYQHSHKQPRITSSLSPKEGQIVQIKGEKNREGWKVGRIVSLIKGSDDLVRIALVKVGDKIFKRSIAHLYPLEIDGDEQPNLVSQEVRQETDSCQLPEATFEKKNIEVLDPMRLTEISQDEPLTDQRGGQSYDEEMIDETVGVINKESCSDQQEVQFNKEEMMDETISVISKEPDADNLSNHGVPTEEDRRPKRIAAVRALEKIREWTQNLMITLL